MLDITKINMSAPIQERKAFYHGMPCFIVLYGKTHSIIQDDYGDDLFQSFGRKIVANNITLHNTLNDYQIWKENKLYKKGEIIGVYLNDCDYVGTALVLKDRESIVDIYINEEVKTILKEYTIRLD